MAHQQMTLQDILTDIHALNQDAKSYERKYGVLSGTFYESYINGEEPDDDSWVLDWADWAGTYKILLRRQNSIIVPFRLKKKHPIIQNGINR